MVHFLLQSLIYLGIQERDQERQEWVNKYGSFDNDIKLQLGLTVT